MASKAAKVMTRVLVLHGYSQNAAILNKRLGALRKESKDVEFVFIDAPHVLAPADLPGATAPAGEAERVGPSAEEIQADPETALRGWWKFDSERTVAIGLDESIALVRDLLREKVYDGVFGFSQGAAFAAILSALLERPHLHPPFLVDGKPPHPPFKFCVAVSGFRLRDPLCASLFDEPFKTPTLHVLGRTDVVVSEERSRALVEISAAARVEEHDGGHFVPTKGLWRKFLVAYMRDPLGTHIPPSAGSAAPSGTTTPLPGEAPANATLDATTGSMTMKL